MREGALKAAIDIFETGRNASAPANGPAANGSQPHPGAGCLRTGTIAVLCAPTRSHPQWGPCSALRCAQVFRAGEFRSRLSLRVTQGTPKGRFSGAAFFGLPFLAAQER